MTIYVELLNKWTKVYRPVPAIHKGNNIYEIQGFDLCNPEDEKWEFLPGSWVSVEKRMLEDTEVLIATKEENRTF